MALPESMTMLFLFMMSPGCSNNPNQGFLQVYKSIGLAAKIPTLIQLLPADAVRQVQNSTLSLLRKVKIKSEIQNFRKFRLEISTTYNSVSLCIRAIVSNQKGFRSALKTQN